MLRLSFAATFFLSASAVTGLPEMTDPPGVTTREKYRCRLMLELLLFVYFNVYVRMLPPVCDQILMFSSDDVTPAAIVTGLILIAAAAAAGGVLPAA
ncbi:hypothetical protein D3C73_913280 [compost metagenome]